MFEVEKPKYEAPLAMAAMGGLWGAGAMGGAGLLGGGIIGGLAGAALGYGMSSMMGGGQMGGMGRQEQQAPAQAPQTAQAVSMPAAPQTPGSTPVDQPIDTSTGKSFSPGEGSAPTSQEIARGELERKRRGRVSTILSNRADTVGEEDNEKLGGPTGGI